jgi:NADH-quinone oxidoreductase subunit M
VGEFLILLGAFQAYWLFGVFAVTGVIFGAAYFLWYYERAMFGPLSPNMPRTIADLNAREMIIAVSLSVMIFWIGLYPSPFLRMMNGSIAALEQRLDRGTVATATKASNVKRETLNEVRPVTSHVLRLTPHEKARL